MKVALTMRGGIYGTLELEEVEVGSGERQLDPKALEVLETAEMSAHAESAPDGPEAPAEVRTESQVFELTITDDDGESRRFVLPESALTASAAAGELVSHLQRLARPRPAGD